MELKINVDETKFGELINDELSNFSKEELHEICRDGLVKIMSDQNKLRELYNESCEYWNRKVSLEGLLNQAAQQVDLSPLFADFEEMARKYIQENYKELLVDIMTMAFVNGLSNHLDRSGFAENIRQEIWASRNPGNPNY